MPRIVKATGTCLLINVAIALASAGCQGDCPCATNVPTAAPTPDQPTRQAQLTQATFGGGIHRNMVNLVDKNVPTTWCVEEGKFKNVKWVADLGTVAHAGPVVFGGRVFVGTNNEKPRNPNSKGHQAVLMCFAEKDGSLLWQNLHDMPAEEVIRAGLAQGLCSTPTVESDFVYYCTPGAEVIRAHVEDGKMMWRYDMMKELGVFPCYECICSPLIVGDTLFVVTGNGTDGLDKLVAPQAPSFVALHKETGKLLWHKNYPGADIIEGQWSNPVCAEVDGKLQVIFPGGDGYLYGLEPKTGDIIWKFKCSPTPTDDDRGIPAYFFATPVVYANRVYVALGAYPDHVALPKLGHFFCIDITKGGDGSCKNENFDPQDPANKGSALVWHFGGLAKPVPVKGRKVHLGSSTSTVAVHDGLVYLAEYEGYLHCLDAKTGERYWEHDFKDTVLSSPYWVDGRIHICSSNGDYHIFEHGKKYQPPRINDMLETVKLPPVVANGVLYIMTASKLYAISAN